MSDARLQSRGPWTAILAGKRPNTGYCASPENTGQTRVCGLITRRSLSSSHGERTVQKCARLRPKLAHRQGPGARAPARVSSPGAVPHPRIRARAPADHVGGGGGQSAWDATLVRIRRCGSRRHSVHPHRTAHCRAASGRGSYAPRKPPRTRKRLSGNPSSPHPPQLMRGGGWGRGRALPLPGGGSRTLASCCAASWWPSETLPPGYWDGATPRP